MPTRYLNDTFPDLTGTITFSGTNQPVTAGCSGKIYLHDIASGDKKIDGAAVAVTPNDVPANRTIEWSYAIQAGDMDRVGQFYAVIEITFADTKIGSFPVSGALNVKMQHVV